MAREVIHLIKDDLDGSEGANPVTFGLDGTWYEIDLTEKNAEKLRRALAGYVAVGRRQGKMVRQGESAGKGAAPAGSARESRERLSAIREWARANGMEVSSTGRIPGSVVEAYDAANPGK